MSPAVRIIGLLVFALLALSARAQSDAERTFRKWADEHVQILQKDRNAGERIKAAEYLGGFEYPNVIQALDAALADPDSRVRAAAAGALWKSGKASEPARAHLLQALDDPSPAVVIRAAGALQTLGMSNAELAAARRRVFDTPDIPNSDRYMAARGLVGYAPPVMLLYPILEFLERAAAPRPTSAHSIAERESFESAVSALERLAKTGDRALIVPIVEATRAARYSQPVLLKALGLFNPKPDGWTEMLVGYLASREPKVREAALSLLGKEVRERDVLVWAPRAAELLSDPDSSVRSEALWSLSRAGGLASAQIDAVVVVLRDSGSRDAQARRGHDRRNGRQQASDHRRGENARGRTIARSHRGARRGGPRRRRSRGSEVDAGQVRGPGARHRSRCTGIGGFGSRHDHVR